MGHWEPPSAGSTALCAVYAYLLLYVHPKSLQPCACYTANSVCQTQQVGPAGTLQDQEGWLAVGVPHVQGQCCCKAKATHAKGARHSCTYSYRQQSLSPSLNHVTHISDSKPTRLVAAKTTCQLEPSCAGAGTTCAKASTSYNNT
jgi:hypothetical protein